MPDPGVRNMPNAKDQGAIRRRLSALMGKKVIWAAYAGRDSAGNPIYRIRYQATARSGRGKATYTAIVNRTVALSGGKVISPFRDGNAFEGGSNQPGGDIALDKAKDRALSWLSSMYNDPRSGLEISQGDFQSLVSQIQNWDRSASQLTLWMEKVIKPNLPFGHVAEEEFQDMEDDFGNWWDSIGGGGGGFAEPVYEAPDRRVIEDMAKGMMVSLLGAVAPDKVEEGVNIYMKDHRRNWDNESVEINPEQSLLEFIRGTEEYETIHALRPSSEDERSWVSDRRAAAQRGGLNTGLQEDFAIEQAQVGGDIQDVEDAAGVEQTLVSGTVRGTTLEAKMKNTVAHFLNGVR